MKFEICKLKSAADGAGIPAPINTSLRIRLAGADIAGDRTPHPGPLPVEGRGGMHAPSLRIGLRLVFSRSPHGERAGVRGAKGLSRPHPLRTHMNRFRGFAQPLQTVETVFPLSSLRSTPLKRGVNGRRCRRAA